MLPSRIEALLAGARGKNETIGRSGAQVLVYDDCVLKLQPCGVEAENEARMLRFLHGKAPVPAVYAEAEEAGMHYLLMERCAGEMACAPSYMENPPLQCEMLAAGLRALWQVDARECPSDQRLARKLVAARYNVEHGLVDTENMEPETLGPGGFASPAALLEWLERNRPAEEETLSHGDYCLPNVFGCGARVSGYIDLGKAGVADKWCDIALCCRSLSHNFAGRYGGRTYPDYDGTRLFRALGIAPDWEKIRYYLLLDELF